MKNSVKILSGLMVALVVVGAITVLAVKYFDVLVRVFDNVRGQITGKKARFFSDDCCDCCDEEDFADDEV